MRKFRVVEGNLRIPVGVLIGAGVTVLKIAGRIEAALLGVDYVSSVVVDAQEIG